VTKIVQADLEWGTAGEAVVGVRNGLPDHIDGVPVGWPPVFTGGRWYREYVQLPMFELRENGDFWDLLDADAPFTITVSPPGLTGAGQ
jgi:hypothetical protein